MTKNGSEVKLPDNLVNKFKLYADNGKLIVELRPHRYEMLSDINRIIKWCDTWSMEQRPEKSNAMHLGKQSNPENYFIVEKRIRVTECERGLGVLVSSGGTNNTTLLHPEPTGFKD